MNQSILFLNGFAFSLCHHGRKFPTFRGAMRLYEDAVLRSAYRSRRKKEKVKKYKETKSLKQKERRRKKTLRKKGN
jgi:hypothetical protein